MQYSTWSQIFLYDEVNPHTCNLNINEWRKVHDENPEAKRMFAKLSIGDKNVYVALGSPINTEVLPQSEHTPIFLPSWVLDTFGIEGSGETVTVEWIDSEYFPEATRIVLRPHDSAFFHADAKEELERVLTTIGILQLASTIPVQLFALGGFSVNFDVVGLEPASLDLMEGDEVAIEFESPLDEAPFSASPPSPVAEISDMLPTEPVVNDGGYKLGGTPMPLGWNKWRGPPRST